MIEKPLGNLSQRQFLGRCHTRFPTRDSAGSWGSVLLLFLSTLGCLDRPLTGERRAGQDPFSEEQQKVFALIDRHDSLDTSTLPFVRVATGRWVQYNSDPEQHRHAVTAAGRAIGSSWGSGVRKIYTKPEGFKRHRKDIQAALDTRHDQTFEIQMSFQFH